MISFHKFCGCCNGGSTSSKINESELIKNSQLPSQDNSIAKAPQPAFKEVYESTPWLLPEQKIFISHSGMQKCFAGQLCVDLQRAGYFPFFDQCGYCLPKGQKFPELLFKAAHRSLLAILLLSEDFFTRSKWPMQELATFVRARESGLDIHILPVLLRLSLNDLKNRPAQWFKVWSKWASEDPRVVLSEWKGAVSALKPFNSIIRNLGEGEVNLRNRIVASIIETMPPDVRSSVLHIQGRERICKEVVTKVNAALPSRPVANAKVLGMFGIGGTGKSTVCKLITEYMRTQFSGRVCHVELKPETSVVKLQRIVLRELITDNKVFLERHITNEDKGWNRLEETMPKHKVFLVLDNVSDAASSVETAQLFLSLKFHDDSLIIVTSRSDQVLCKQLGIPGSNCFHCPNLNVEEALDIILDKLIIPIEGLNEAQKQILDQTVERSFFDGYHPLALRLFAGQLGADPTTWRLSELDIQESSDEKHPLFSIIETSYNSLPNQQVKDMFLDIALFTPEDLCTIEDISTWLNDTVYHESDVVHLKREGVEQIKRKLNILRAKSLLEVWTSKDGETVRVHDLYRMLAERETSLEASYRHISRFIYQRGASVSPTALLDTTWARIIERAAFVEAQFEMLVLEACSNLQVLSLRKCENLQAVHMQRLRCLVSLELTVCPLEGLDLSGLNKLRWLHVSSCEKLTTLDASGLAELGCVNVSKCSTLREVNMKNCLWIRSVSVLYNDKLSFVNLGICQHLTSLILWFCESLTNVEVSGFACVTIFKKKGCFRLWNFQGSEHIFCKDLKCMSLELWGKLSRTCVRILEIAVSLQVLDLWNCPLSRLPDLTHCLRLRELKLNNVDVLLCSKNRKLLHEYVRLLRIPAKDLQLPVNLEYIRIESCRNVVLKEVLLKLQGLRELRLLLLKEVRVGWDWELYRYTGGLNKSTYYRLNRMDFVLGRPSSGLGLEEESTGLEETVDEWSHEGTEQSIDGGDCEDDKELIVLQNQIDTFHANLSKMGLRENEAKIHDGEATPSLMRGVPFEEPAILEHEALTRLSADDVSTSQKGKHCHLNSESEVFDDDIQDRTDAVNFLYKIMLWIQVIFDVKHSTTPLEQLIKEEFQSQLIKLELRLQWKTKTEPNINVQNDQVGQLFWNYMDKAVRFKGSPCWIVEQIILATCCSYDSLCEIIWQDQCSEPPSDKVIREQFQKIVVEEIRKQLLFLTAIDCVMQQDTFEKWESTVFREVLSRIEPSAGGIQFYEGIVSTMPRLETLVKRLNILLECRNWKFQSKLDSDDQSLEQVVRDWLCSSNLCLSIEQLRGFLARRNETENSRDWDLDRQPNQDIENLDGVLQEIQELISKFDEIFKTEMEKIPKDVLASVGGCDQKVHEQLFSLMRCLKVSHWLQELESCLSDHMMEVKNRRLMITQDYMLINEMYHLAADIEEKLVLMDFYCPPIVELLEATQGLTHTSSRMEELGGKAALLAADLKQNWPSTELLYYLLDVVNKRKVGVLENVEDLYEKTNRFLKDMRMECTSFASHNDMNVGWINDIVVLISRLKIKQLQCVKLVRCSLDPADAESMEELWQKTKTLVDHQMRKDWLGVCGDELWTSLAQEVLELTWEWIENLQAKLTEEIQYMGLVMCPFQTSSIEKFEKTGLLDRIRKLVFLLTKELTCVKCMVAQLADHKKRASYEAKMAEVWEGRWLVSLAASLRQGTLLATFQEFVGEAEVKRVLQIASDGGESAVVSPGKLRALVVGGGQIRLKAKPEDKAEADGCKWWMGHERLISELNDNEVIELTDSLKPNLASTSTLSSFPIKSMKGLDCQPIVSTTNPSCFPIKSSLRKMIGKKLFRRLPSLGDEDNIELWDEDDMELWDKDGTLELSYSKVWDKDNTRQHSYTSPFIKLWDEANTKQLLTLPFSQCVALRHLCVYDCRLQNPKQKLAGDWATEDTLFAWPSAKDHIVTKRGFSLKNDEE